MLITKLILRCTVSKTSKKEIIVYVYFWLYGHNSVSSVNLTYITFDPVLNKAALTI